jgi:hypothetical protein
MIDMKIRADGMHLFRNPIRIQGAVKGASGRFMQRQGAVFLRWANQLTPVGQDWSQAGGFNRPGHPGLLARSNQLRIINQYAAEIVNVQPYAIFVQRGTRPHTPPASSGLPWPVRRAIGLHGTRAQPWYDEAFQRGMAEVQGNLDAMANEVLREIGGG